VNPDHLEPVSQQVNSQRGARAKITLEIAREILNSEEPRRVLAERYGISLTTVDHIKTGRVWKNAA
jgi:Trp operon repressor